MDMSPEEAKRQLDGALAVEEATRVVAALKGTDLMMFAWGAVLILGFGWSDLVVRYGWPRAWHGLWWPLLAAGGVATFVLMRREAQPVDNPGVGKRLAVLWASVFLYAFLGMSVLGPYLDRAGLNGTAEGAKAMSVLHTLLPLFTFIAMGLLFQQSFFFWLAAPLTVLMLVGYLLFNDIYFLYMMVVFGGVLVGSGVWMRVRWHAALRKAGAYAES